MLHVRACSPSLKRICGLDRRLRDGRWTEEVVMKAQSPIVYIVDDDDSVRKALSRVLNAAGFTVRDYASAQEFTLARPQDHPGCVILDLRMPGVGGLELQQALANVNEGLPVLFLTAHP